MTYLPGHYELLNLGRRQRDLEKLPEENNMAAAGRISLKVRSFSTSVSRPVAKLVRPPIPMFGLEGRYATALYSAASKEKKLDQVEKDITRMAVLLKDPKVSGVIANPHIKRVAETEDHYRSGNKRKVFSNHRQLCQSAGRERPPAQRCKYHFFLRQDHECVSRRGPVLRHHQFDRTENCPEWFLGERRDLETGDQDGPHHPGRNDCQRWGLVR